MKKSRILSAMISVAMLASCFTAVTPVSAAPADVDAVSVENDVDAAAELMAVEPTTYDFTKMESVPVYSAEAKSGFVSTTSSVASKTTTAGKADTSVGTGRTVAAPDAITMNNGAVTNNAAGMVFRVDVDRPGAYRVIVTGVNGTTKSNTAVAVSGMEASRLTSTSAWDTAGLVKKTAPAVWSDNVWSYDYVTGENFIEIEIEGIGGAEVGVASISIAPFEEKTAGDKPTVFVLGDSTQKTYTFEENSMSGYGQVLYQMFDLSKVNVINYSMGGRSMRTNFQEGRFNDVLLAARPGDYVFIHSAHNDETTDENVRFGRGTSAGMYKNFLENVYIPAIKAVGAIPVLVTSMPRTSDGAYKENTDKPNGFNPDSPGMMRAAAKADTGVKLVELYNGAKEYIDKIGAAETTYIYQSLEAGETAGKTNSGSYANGHPDNKIDGTHYKEAYAKQLARIIAQDIYAQKSDDKLGILANALSDGVKAACADGDWTKHVFPEMAKDVSTVGGTSQGTNAYYRNQIEKMLQLGIMAKDSEGNFNPKAPMTVGSFANSLTKAWSLDASVLSDYTGSVDDPDVTEKPTEKPTDKPDVTEKPTEKPTDKPDVTEKPTDKPTDKPNETTAPVDAVKAVVTYGVDGRLTSVTLDTNYKYTGSVEEVSGAKVLVWNNLTDMKPLCDPVTAPAVASLSEATVKYEVDASATYTANQVIALDGITLTLGDDTFETKAYGGLSGYTAYVSGKNNPKDAGGAVYTAANGPLPTVGSYFILNPAQDGKISVAYVLNADKPFFIVEADGESNAPVEGFGGNKETAKVYTTSEFNVTGGKSYYVFCTGSKLGLFGFEYTPGAAIATPTPKPTADPNATPEPELVENTAIDKDAALTREAMAAIVYDAYEAKFGKKADGSWNKPVYMTNYNGTNLSPDDPNYDPNLKGESAQYYPMVGWGLITDLDQFHTSLYGKAKEVYNLGLMRSEKGIARGKMVNGTEMEPLTVVTREKAAKELYFLYNLIQDIKTENQVIPGENMAFTLTEELATPDSTKPSYPGGGSVDPGETTAPTTQPTANPDLPEDKAWVSSDASLDAIVLAAGDNTKFGPYNGLSGYGKWVSGGSKLTYTHTNGVTYSFDHGWQAGSGGDTSRNFYFTPEQACIVTVAYTAQAGRPVYIAQGGAGASYRLAEGMDGATDGHPAVLTVDIEDPSKGDVYIVGGSSNKQVYGIFADYYDPTVVVLRNVSGKINYTGSADTSNAKIVFTDTNDGTRYEVPFAAEYSVELRQNRTYNISVEENGQLSETLATTLDTNSVSVAKMDKTHDIDVVAIGLTDVTGDVVVHEYTPNDGTTLDLSKVSLTFTAKDDATYTYTVPAGAIANNKYTVTMMPNHEYTVTANNIDGYTLSKLSGSYVMAAGDTTPFKNILITEDLGEVAFTSTVEVGPNKTYTKIRDAIAAVKAMKDRPAGEKGRVEIVIDPGNYVEQIIVDTGYVTLKAANPENRPEINWYYGIGYKYYSANGGYYSEDSAVQKTEKNNVDRWGCAIRIYAQYVLMENIKVIDTFNCRVTAEELADGVEPGVYGDVSGKPDRTVAGYDAMSQAATERAAAIAIDGNYFEAYQCDFVSSQDTFYTNTTGSYIKKCYIEGGTDYIYGGTQIVFDECTLAWHGYSDNAKGGYITACSDNGRTFGYLFNNCTVTNSKYFTSNKFAAGGWGRNWGGANCHVVFDNVTIADGVEAPTGWTQMGGPLDQSVIYVNNVHKADGTAITGNGFNPNGTMEDNGYTLHKMYEYFDGWNPPHFDGYQPEKTEYTTTWYFGRSNGAPEYDYQGAGTENIEIYGTGDNPVDQLLVVNATSGKFSNTGRNDDWCQVNGGTTLTVPVVNGSVITFGAYDDNQTWVANGEKFTRNGSYVYGGPAGTVTVSVETGGYASYIRVVSPAKPTEATPVPRFTVTFDKGATDAEGEVPAFETVEQGKTVAIPVNRTLYKEDNTLTGWTDGTNTYATGTSFAPTASVTLTPVFTANTLPYKGTVDFNAVKNSGAPSVFVGENKTGIYVVQDENGTDLKMGIDTSGNGKFDNSNGGWIQINDNTKLTVPVYVGSEVTVGQTYYGTETYTINGAAFTGGQGVEHAITVDEAGIATIVATKGGYFTNVKVTYPEGAETPKPEETAAPTDEPEETAAPTEINYEIDLRENSKWGGTEQWSSPLSDGTVEELAANGIIINGAAYHSSDHGACKVTSIDIDAPGPLKITIGDCQFGADGVELLVGADSVSSTKLKTGCYNNNSTEGKGLVVLYYRGPDASDITVKFGNGTYLPYLKVESVDESDLPDLVDEVTVTYTKGDDESVEGTVPAAETVNINSEVTISKYGLLYKEGYTLTAWTPDNGATEYKVGGTFTANESMTLTPIFTKNAEDARPAGEVVIDFQQKNGAPVIAWQNRTGDVYVAQGTTADGKPIDVKIEVNTTNSGKLNNASWTDWAQCNGGTVFTVPVVNGAVVKVGTIMNGSVEGAYSINGVSKTGSDQSETITDDVTTATINIVNVGYIRTISVTYPD